MQASISFHATGKEGLQNQAASFSTAIQRRGPAWGRGARGDEECSCARGGGAAARTRGQIGVQGGGVGGAVGDPPRVHSSHGDANERHSTGGHHLEPTCAQVSGTHDNSSHSLMCLGLSDLDDTSELSWVH
jgi:hypothetical protein